MSISSEGGQFSHVLLGTVLLRAVKGSDSWSTRLPGTALEQMLGLAGLSMRNKVLSAQRTRESQRESPKLPFDWCLECILKMEYLLTVCLKSSTFLLRNCSEKSNFEIPVTYLCISKSWFELQWSHPYFFCKSFKKHSDSQCNGLLCCSTHHHFLIN